MRPQDLWLFLPLGYLVTVAIETPVLVFGLSTGHPLRRRLFAGLWLTASTYPVVVLILPLLFGDASRASYLIVAETFAPLAECALFRAAFHDRPVETPVSMWRDYAAIVAANLASFLLGEVFNARGWFGLFG